MNLRLFVGNIPYSTTDTELRSLFGQAGAIMAVSIPLLHEQGQTRGRGFAFVEMVDAEGVREAIARFDGVDWKGRRLNVSVAKPRETQPRVPGHQAQRARTGRRDARW